MKSILKIAFLLATAYAATYSLGAATEIEHSTSIPFSESYYYHFSKDQKLGDLIHDFCSMQNVSVVVSQNISDIVNGRFNKMSPSEFWDYVTRAYSLSWFYDGKILYAYKSSELQTQVFKMDSNGIVILSDIIKNLGFSSSDFSFRSVPEAHILIVTAPPKYLDTINDLAAKFVTEKISDTTVVKSFPLKYAWAYDMSFTYKDGSLTVPGVATLLQNIVSGENTTSVSGMSVDLGKGGPQKIDKMQTLVMQTKNNANANDKNSGNKSEQNSDGGEKINTPSTLPGLITCDQRLNAIIIRDRYENMAFYEDIIKQLDIPCEVIKIDVSIVDIDRSDRFTLGFDTINVSKNGSSAPSSQGGTDASSKQFTANSKGAVTFNGILKKYVLDATITALEENGNAQTVAKPSVLTLDNVGAIIEKGTTAYVKTSGDHAEGLYDVTATMKLQVVPHIIPGEIDGQGKHKMKMFVNVEDGSLAGTAEPGGTPTTDSNSINTQAVLYEGQSLLIGGYFKESHTKIESGIPFIMNIPIIGNLFKYTKNEKSIKERIYVISPSIVDINSEDHEYDKFLPDGYLSAGGEYTLSQKGHVWGKVVPQKRTRISRGIGR
jgi:type III secretion protein C